MGLSLSCDAGKHFLQKGNRDLNENVFLFVPAAVRLVGLGTTTVLRLVMGLSAISTLVMGEFKSERCPGTICEVVIDSLGGICGNSGGGGGERFKGKSGNASLT